MLAIHSERIKLDIHFLQERLIVVVQVGHTLQRLHHGILRRPAAPHGLHNRVPSGNANVEFAQAGRTAAANVRVHKQPGADYRRIAHPAPGQSRGRRYA